MPTPTPNQIGTAITWGTMNAFSSGDGTLVNSISVTPKNANPVGEIENGDGAGVTLILLADGFSAKVNVDHNPAKTYPAEGDNANLYLPAIGANGIGNYAVSVVSLAPGRTKKKNATLDISVEYRPAIHGSPANS